MCRLVRTAETEWLGEDNMLERGEDDLKTRETYSNNNIIIISISIFIVVHDYDVFIVIIIMLILSQHAFMHSIYVI